MKLYILKTIFKKKLGVCIGMIVMISLGISIFVGMNSFLKTLDDSLQKYVVENNYPDAVFNTDVFYENIITIKEENKKQEELIQEYLDKYGYKNKYEALKDYKNKNNIKSNQEAINQLIKEYTNESIEYIKKPINSVLENISGVLSIDTRLNLYTKIKYLDKNYSSRIIVYKSDKFNKFKIWQKVQKSNLYRNIYIEKNFAEKNNIKTEDIIEINIGEENYKLYVQAIVTTPENLGATLEYASIDINYGYIYISQEELNLEDYEDYANEVLIKIDNIFSKEKIQEAVIEKLKEYDINTISSYTYEQSNVKERINRNTDPIKTLCKIVPVAFYIITIIILYLCFSIIIKTSRRNISIYRAIGINTKTIKKEYCKFGILIVFISCVLSMPICYLLIHVMSTFYNNFFNVDCIETKIDYLYLLISYVIVLCTCLIATITNCKRIVKYKPIEALTLNTCDDYETPYLIRKVFKNTKPMFKFSLITYLKNRSQLIFTIICITSTIAIIYSSCSFIAGNNVIIDSLFKERINYDYAIYFTKEPEERIIQDIFNLKSVSELENVKIYKNNLQHNGLTYEVLINGISTNSTLIKIPDVNELSKQGIVLDQYSAAMIKAKVGDQIVFNDKELEVVGISQQYVNRIEYISYEQAKAFGESEYGCLVCKCNNYEELINYVENMDTFITCKSINELNITINELFESFVFVSVILIVFSIIIGFCVVLICIKTNLIERAKQISVLRAVGYTAYEISINNFIQLMMQLLISIVIGLPLGKGISMFTLKLVETSDRTYPYANGTKEIILTIAIVLIYMIFAQIIAHIEIKKWQLSQEIKDND